MPLQVLEQPIVTASSGAAALAICGQRELAVILLDVQMPDMDGFAVVERVPASSRGASTPIIFVTALETDSSSVK